MLRVNTDFMNKKTNITPLKWSGGEIRSYDKQTTSHSILIYSFHIHLVIVGINLPFPPD